VSVCLGGPQVDLCVCFDTGSSPVRNIQRSGRTGRHKQGRVIYIMTDKERDKYEAGIRVSMEMPLRRAGQALPVGFFAASRLPRPGHTPTLYTATLLSHPRVGAWGARASSSLVAFECQGFGGLLLLVCPCIIAMSVIPGVRDAPGKAESGRQGF
jgi:hypothetical protein